MIDIVCMLFVIFFKSETIGVNGVTTSKNIDVYVCCCKY